MAKPDLWPTIYGGMMDVAPHPKGWATRRATGYYSEHSRKILFDGIEFCS